MRTASILGKRRFSSRASRRNVAPQTPGRQPGKTEFRTRHFLGRRSQMGSFLDAGLVWGGDSGNGNCAPSRWPRRSPSTALAAVSTSLPRGPFQSLHETVLLPHLEPSSAPVVLRKQCHLLPQRAQEHLAHAVTLGHRTCPRPPVPPTGQLSPPPRWPASPSRTACSLRDAVPLHVVPPSSSPTSVTASQSPGSATVPDTREQLRACLWEDRVGVWAFPCPFLFCS